MRRPITNNPFSSAAWLLISLVVAPLEIWLLWKKGHSLSEQMRWWIRYSKLGSVLMMFWIWVTVHFVIEPVVRKVSIYLRSGSYDQ